MAKAPPARILVTGAGGFIGHHLVSALVERGYWVRGVDIANPVFEESSATEFLKLDLTNWDRCLDATERMDYVFALASASGRKNRAEASRDATLINIHTLEACRVQGARRILFASSSLVYPAKPEAFDEESAECEDMSWDDLSMERLCRKYRKDFRLETRIARLHNVYGPLSAYEEPNRISPAAICRRVAEVVSGGVLELPGDGRQSHAYTYIDDCIVGLMRVMRSSYAGPLNIAGPAPIALNDLVNLLAGIAGKAIRKEYSSDRPQSSGRLLNTDLAKQKLLWEPSIGMEEGLRRTYRWVERELGYEGRLPAVRSAVA